MQDDNLEKGEIILNRTIEKVLALIASILNVFGIASTGIILFSIDNLMNSNYVQEKAQQNVNEGISMAQLQNIFDLFGSLGWLIIIVLLISLILGTAGMIKLRTDAKFAGILFIGAGIFACIISLSSVLFYVAAILCFTRHKNQPQESLVGKNRQHIPTGNPEQYK